MLPAATTSLAGASEGEFSRRVKREYKDIFSARLLCLPDSSDIPERTLRHNFSVEFDLSVRHTSWLATIQDSHCLLSALFLGTTAYRRKNKCINSFR